MSKSCRFTEPEYVYCNGRSWYEENMDTSYSNFRHNPNNASQAHITLTSSNSYVIHWVQWVNPNPFIGSSAWFQTSVQGLTGFAYGSRQRWGNCIEVTGAYGSGTATAAIGTGDTQIRIENWCTNDTSNWRSWYTCYTVEDLTTNYRITPPTGLASSISSFSTNNLKCSASISSWSANTNIKGTPYTSGGGRNWNFMAEIKNGNTVLYRQEKNTGETKSCSWDFTNLNLPTETNLTLRVVVSNDYQQTQEKTSTFKIQRKGWIVTPKSTKAITDYKLTQSEEDGGKTIQIKSVRKV